MQTQQLFEPGSDRYAFDFKLCTSKRGWAQIDTKQDASYYGTWANPFERVFVNYCEGDVTIKRCNDDAEFVQVITENKEWNVAAGYWLGIDGMCDERIINKFKELGLGELLH